MIAGLVFEYVIIAALLWLATQTDNVLAWWLIALVIGNRIHALGIIGHWALHGLLPRWVMWLAFIPGAIDHRVYRASHTIHHKHLGEIVDPEVQINLKYKKRWERVRWWDTLLDITGLHTDEAISIMRVLASPSSLMLWAILVLALGIGWMGWAAVVLPMAFLGTLATHRWRARYEHNHLGLPGVTFVHNRPPFWVHVLVLPYGAWLHAEHHEWPNQVVWRLYD